MTDSAENLENLWGKIAAISRDEIRLAVLQDEIEIHKSRLQPYSTDGTGSLHDVITVIQNRIDEIQLVNQLEIP